MNGILGTYTWYNWYTWHVYLVQLVYLVQSVYLAQSVYSAQSVYLAWSVYSTQSVYLAWSVYSTQSVYLVQSVYSVPSNPSNLSNPLLMYIASRHAALMASCSTLSINFVIGISLALEPDCERGPAGDTNCSLRWKDWWKDGSGLLEIRV
ncbi:hypothetical protein BU25DRAFT_33437 [Macroventuria anomochaeta]|uniref:Uncharacterized protein n=1 Tax=Macroventuria anomochaeta TaxID=301207 RepID=A0ACB6S202_9PLEO|nr:uncharacterized protein BU25DRAFT_33437 [Macroventuria anomochaeta]KAF2628311.1 hypothetical protein BU25DRAFT_33437 [Macroventuria anomochaeta]